MTANIAEHKIINEENRHENHSLFLQIHCRFHSFCNSIGCFGFSCAFSILLPHTRTRIRKNTLLNIVLINMSCLIPILPIPSATSLFQKRIGAGIRRSIFQQLKIAKIYLSWCTIKRRSFWEQVIQYKSCETKTQI